MRGTIVEAEDLSAITGYDRHADAARCLRQQGIRVFEGRGGRPWTTVALIEAAGGLSPSGQYDDKYNPSDLL